MRELNFFEAMKAADEGKVVVSNRGDKYKKDVGGKLILNHRDQWVELRILEPEINGPWTIEEPAPTLPTLPQLLGEHYPVSLNLPPANLREIINSLVTFAADLQKQIKELKGER